MKAIVLVGPTAVGKTGISLDLAKDGYEIISSDSVQVYKYLDIGSGKPEVTEREKIPHHLIDIIEPDVSFTAGDYCRLSLKLVKGIQKRGNIPFFVGGTGLYIDSFFKGIADIPEPDKKIRINLTEELEKRGPANLYNELLHVDEVYSKKVHPNDKQRIIRGLEVFRSTGRPISSYYNTNMGYESDKTLYVGIFESRNILIKRINERVDSMIASGLPDEVRMLRDMGFGPELKSMRSIGYREINKYLDGYIKFDEAVDLIKSETRAYAKRQMTWFRKNKKICWFNPGEYVKIVQIINKWKEL